MNNGPDTVLETLPERVVIPMLNNRPLLEAKRALQGVMGEIRERIKQTEALPNNIFYTLEQIRLFTQNEAGITEQVELRLNNIMHYLLDEQNNLSWNDFCTNIAEYIHLVTGLEQEGEATEEFLLFYAKIMGYNNRDDSQAFIKTYFQAWCLNVTRATIPVAQVTQGDNNSALYSIIHSYMGPLLTLSAPSFIEKMKENAVFNDIVMQFFRRHPSLGRNVNALLKFNQDNTPNHLEIFWTEIFRTVLNAHKEHLGEERCREEQARLEQEGALAEDIEAQMNAIRQEFDQPFDTGCAIPPQVILAFAKSLGLTCAIYNLQGIRQEYVITPPASYAKTVKLVRNLHPGDGTHYDFFPSLPQAPMSRRLDVSAVVLPATVIAGGIMAYTTGLNWQAIAAGIIAPGLSLLRDVSARGKCVTQETQQIAAEQSYIERHNRALQESRGTHKSTILLRNIEKIEKIVKEINEKIEMLECYKLRMYYEKTCELVNHKGRKTPDMRDFEAALVQSGVTNLAACLKAQEALVKSKNIYEKTTDKTLLQKDLYTLTQEVKNLKSQLGIQEAVLAKIKNETNAVYESRYKSTFDQVSAEQRARPNAILQQYRREGPTQVAKRKASDLPVNAENRDNDAKEPDAEDVRVRPLKRRLRSSQVES